MTIDVEKLKAQEYEKKVIKFIEDVDLVYSTADKLYMTNQTVNYSKYKHSELCDMLEIWNVSQRNKFKRLALKYATVQDHPLPKEMGIRGDL